MYKIKGEITITANKSDNSLNNLINTAEKALRNKVDIKYYKAVTALLEKGYLLDDISSAFLMALCENKKEVKNQVPKGKKESKKRSVKQPENRQKSVAPKRTEKNSKNFNRKPKRKVKTNENSNS